MQSFSLLADAPNRIRHFLKELATEYKKARQAAETIKELNKLSNAELRDIGISRGEIHDIAIKTHYGER
jgi:uncharacterized protein YjiS (DUF1127 family)